jgi:hypothetical protein
LPELFTHKVSCPGNSKGGSPYLGKIKMVENASLLIPIHYYVMANMHIILKKQAVQQPAYQLLRQVSCEK